MADKLDLRPELAAVLRFIGKRDAPVRVRQRPVGILAELAELRRLT